jgi:hypothetical protein
MNCICTTGWHSVHWVKQMYPLPHPLGNHRNVGAAWGERVINDDVRSGSGLEKLQMRAFAGHP